MHRKIFDEFLRTFSEKTSALRVGDGINTSTDIGPLTSRDQRLRVMRAVRQAVSEEAEVKCGGTVLSGAKRGFFYSLTVLVKVSPSMKVMSEKIFGSVVPCSNETEWKSTG